MFAFAQPRRLKRPSLTPMIDVVFLLLVFFMLAARFGQETGLELQLAGNGAPYQGPPRLVELAPEGLLLNGMPVGDEALAGELTRLTDTPADIILLRPRAGADVQRLVDVMSRLSEAGFTGLSLVE